MKGVVKTFPGVKALDHAQLELRPGKVMALMGENGAGKSTLMKCMFGIYKMDEGEIEYEGQKVNIPTPLDALDRGIAMVHQEQMCIRDSTMYCSTRRSAARIPFQPTEARWFSGSSP